MPPEGVSLPAGGVWPVGGDGLAVLAAEVDVTVAVTGLDAIGVGVTVADGFGVAVGASAGDQRPLKRT